MLCQRGVVVEAIAISPLLTKMVFDNIRIDIGLGDAVTTPKQNFAQGLESNYGRVEIIPCLLWKQMFNWCVLYRLCNTAFPVSGELYCAAHQFSAI